MNLVNKSILQSDFKKDSQKLSFQKEVREPMDKHTEILFVL